MKLCSKCRVLKDLSEFHRKAVHCKECVRIYSKEWYERNREDSLEKSARYYQENKEISLIRGRKWREENKSRIYLLRKKWEDENREMVNQKRRDRRLKNREAVLLKEAKYRKNNHEKILAKNSTADHKRRAKLKNLDKHFTLREWEDLILKCDFNCQMCFKKFNKRQLEKDHIIPISKNGSNEISNIQPLCKSCNCKKGSKVRQHLFLLNRAGPELFSHI